MCTKYTNCSLYDEVCGKLEFLKNFIEINNSNEIAKYCKKYKTKKYKQGL